ncbi:hypothetical protein HYDPIDRAFT_29077 [Hydnomerulius pinastri MD-312]|uniref:Uncharacterized protein n=1 Tax=Hydnomerulius pinastri MD-312 TaxID=994086 RepID=A0A0C9WEY3_9AGAM|nr:hypothetical protein HYDPIDRAFT_29077 [Hydnomerulius pinastri MD-312]
MDGTINICEKCWENNQECEAWEDRSAIVDCNGQFIFDKGTWDQHTVPNPNGGPDQGKHADRSTASSEPSSTPPSCKPSVEQVSGVLVTLNMNQPPAPTKLQELEERLRAAEMEREALQAECEENSCAIAALEIEGEVLVVVADQKNTKVQEQLWWLKIMNYNFTLAQESNEHLEG